MKRSTFLQLLLASPLAAQRGGEPWNFLEYSSVFPDVHGMLPAWLKAKAAALLEERRKTVAAIGTEAGLAERRRYLRERIWSYLGGQPERTPLNARVIGTVERDDHRIEKIIFESRPGFRVTANLYLPKSGAAPYFVCLTWDPIGQGERIQYYDADLHTSKAQASTVEHTMLGQKCLLAGTHTAAFTIWDGIRALDYLVSRPEVDPKRIGCTGNSGGGTHTSYLSALDDRIQVSAACCYITSWKRMLESIGPQDAEQVFPWFLADGFDYPDYLYGHGTKPFLILSGIRDFFPILGARASYREVKETFTRLGAAAKVAMFEWDDGHGYNPQRRLAGYRWLTRWLKGAEDTSPEAPVELKTFHELQCTRSGQLLTEFPDGDDAHNIVRRRAESQRSTRKTSPADLRRAVAQLTHYEAPSGVPAVVNYGTIPRAHCRVEKLTFESEPGIVVPCLLFLPTAEGRHPAVILADAAGKASAAGVAERLAERGMVVLAPDLRGLGETRAKQSEGGSWSRAFGDYDSSATAILVGRTVPGMRALDVVQAVELLASRPEVDAARITAAGTGVAAVPVLFAALFDSRIQRLVLEGMLVSYQAVINERLNQDAPEQIVPGAMAHFDLPDILAALSPRRVDITNAVSPLGQELTKADVEQEYRAAANVRVAVRDRDDEPFGAILPKLLEA
ncbi:MAG: acetylxylan esterase [Acidobacteria bacterium]|nr:acetylxylan esterase [Acidobacteriota bacterium]